MILAYPCLGISFRRHSTDIGENTQTAFCKSCFVFFVARVVLLTNTLSQTALHIAARGGKLSMCLLLVQHRVNMNALDKEGNSAVFYALRAGCTEVAAFVLQEGANCEGTNRDGNCALHFAAFSEVEASMHRLLAVGAWDTNQQNNVIQTAVHVRLVFVIDYNDISKLHFYISLQLP